MLRVRRIVEMAIGQRSKTVVCGSFGSRRCHPVSLTLIEGIRSLQGSHYRLDETVVLLNEDVEIFDLINLDQPETPVQQRQDIHLLQSC